jgi:hypothetical protein
MPKVRSAPSRRTLASVTGAILAALALPALLSGAAAVPVIDQSNSALPTMNFSAVRSGFTTSQTFIVGFSGTLTGVDVIVDSRGTPAANLDLAIQGTVGGVADGNTLASASVAPFAPGNPTISFDVSGAALSVAAGDTLAFVLSTAATLGNDYLARAVPSNRYARGEFTDSGGAFASGAGWDMIFDTFVEPASLPGPGSSDQANWQVPTTNFAAVAVGLTAAQTFTVGVDGVLTRVDVVVDPRNTPVLDLVLEVQETSGGAANGTLLASSVVAPFTGTNPTVTFDVSPYNLAVSQGEVLAFVLRSNAALGTDYLARAVPFDTYAGGEFTNSTGGFPSGSGWDSIFETFVAASVTGVEVASGPLLAGLVLERSRPNPLSDAGAIRFALPAPGPASLRVYDLGGRLVRTLVSGDLAEGSHEVTWRRDSDRGEHVAAGVYFYRLVAGGETRSERVVVVR